jgi:hypothetical protein
LDFSSLNIVLPQQFTSQEEKEVTMVIADSANAFVNINIIVLIIGQIFAGQIIKKMIPLFLKL